MITFSKGLMIALSLCLLLALNASFTQEDWFAQEDWGRLLSSIWWIL